MRIANPDRIARPGRPERSGPVSGADERAPSVPASAQPAISKSTSS